MAATAPCSRHTARFSSVDATATTRAPSAAAMSTAASPTPPAAPSTATHSPGCTRPTERREWYAVP